MPAQAEILAALAALLMGIPQLADISGKVLDRTGKPLANAHVVYTNVDTGKTYKFKTDKKGEFSGVGVVYGVYQIVITSPDGESLYRGKRKIADPNTPGFTRETNVLVADLSILPAIDLPGGIQANVTGDKKLTEQQKAVIRASNAKVEEMNQMIRKLHAALDEQHWPEAADILRQLIAADPNRWEFYQNLGTIQSNQSQYEDAAKSYERGIELAQSGITTGTQPSKNDISLMMVYAGDAYSRTGNPDRAIELYSKAAEISPDPAAAYFNICRVYRSNGNLEGAAQACNKALAIAPERWEFYQALAAVQQLSSQEQTAAETYAKGIQLAERMISANPDNTQAKIGLGQMLSSQGNIYVHMKKFNEAISAFSQAVDLAAYPAREYFNMCAVLYDTNRMDSAVEACNKAIAADPAMADAYFVKASALYGNSKLERGKLNVPDGTAEALSKYLELEPQGQHAKDAREMLARIGSPIDTILKPRSK